MARKPLTPPGAWSCYRASCGTTAEGPGCRSQRYEVHSVVDGQQHELSTTGWRSGVGLAAVAVLRRPQRGVCFSTREPVAGSAPAAILTAGQCAADLPARSGRRRRPALASPPAATVLVPGPATTPSSYETERRGSTLGVVGCAVGAPFAVLVAEELFVVRLSLLVSMTSAGQVADDLQLPWFILIERALRGEGTQSPLSAAGHIGRRGHTTTDAAVAGLAQAGLTALRGVTWTTDAPFRETASSLTTARAAGALAVEMEAAALYAFAQASKQPVICFAHVDESDGAGRR